jgi:hypothetical protein
MNPFSLFLTRKAGTPPITEFVQQWDILEAVVVQVYKSKQVTDEVALNYADARAWLVENYPHWQAKLSPYWQGLLIGGKPATSDPFLALLAHPAATEFLGNWLAMQTLPAARQALNQLLWQANSTS